MTITSTTPPQVATSPLTVHLTLLLDRSGSMNKIRQDTIGGVNQLIADQQAQPGSCKFTMITFDSQGYDYVHMATDIHNVRPLTEADFVPRGGTPLYDSIDRAITELDVRVGAIKVPEVQLFAIFTDGEDTCSDKDRSDVFVKIEEHQAKGWTFTYLGANQDAYSVSAGLGIAKGSTQAYLGDGAGAVSAYASFSANTSAMRGAAMKGVAPDPTAFFVAAGKGAEEDLLARKPDDAAAQGVKIVDPDVPEAK